MDAILSTKIPFILQSQTLIQQVQELLQLVDVKNHLLILVHVLFILVFQQLETVSLISLLAIVQPTQIVMITVDAQLTIVILLQINVNIPMLIATVNCQMEHVQSTQLI
jgi:hypothetical protein